jgi:ABC-type bacteriocin/lantibiotic exporter with double-glycine peptidase domain
MACLRGSNKMRFAMRGGHPAPSHPPESSPRSLLADFAAISGAEGLVTLTYVLAAALLEGLSFSLLIPLLGVVFGTGAPLGRVSAMIAHIFAVVGVATPFARLLLLLSLFAFLMSLRAVALGLRDISVMALQMRFTSTLRLRLAERLASTRWEHIARLRHARVTQLMGSDIQRLAIGVDFLLRGTAAAAVLVAQCTLVLIMAPKLAAAMVVLMGLGVLALAGTMQRMRALSSTAMEANLSLLHGTAQFLGGLKLAMSQGLESGFVREIEGTLRRQVERQGHFIRQQAIGRTGLTVLAAVLGSTLLLVGYGSLGVPPAILVAFSLIGTRMVGPAGQIQQGAQQLATVLPIYESLQVLERELIGVSDPLGAASEYPQGLVTFSHVSYWHASEAANGLSNFSLTLLPGEFLGITGVSGAGKTTFADLLAGLYPPQAGEILAGGRRLEGATLAAWRQGLSYVSQDAFLFHDTIRRNLAWGEPLAEETAMWAALAVTGAEELVRGMANGLDTLVGERGSLMSGGERQRIALARALLRSPRLLILDEATSALDTASERTVMATLAMLRPRLTIVAIAHRRENLDLCDRVIVIQNNADSENCNVAS